MKQVPHALRIEETRHSLDWQTIQDQPPDAAGWLESGPTSSLKSDLGFLRIPVPTLGFAAESASPPLKEDQHHEREEQVQFLSRGQISYFFDFKTALPKRGLLGDPHRRAAIRATGEVAGVEKIAAKHAEDWNFS